MVLSRSAINQDPFDQHHDHVAIKEASQSTLSGHFSNAANAYIDSKRQSESRTTASSLTKFKVHHEQSGLTITPFTQEHARSAADFYVSVNKDNPNFTMIGLAGKALQEYAAFAVDLAVRTMYSVVAVDDEGIVRGVNICLQGDMSSIDISSLEGTAKVHWSVFTELEKAVKERADWNLDGHCVSFFMGIDSKFRGEGIVLALTCLQGDIMAYRFGHPHRLWSWTATPVMAAALLKLSPPVIKAAKAALKHMKGDTSLFDEMNKPTPNGRSYGPDDSHLAFFRRSTLSLPSVGKDIGYYVSSCQIPTTADLL
eukprot:CAMPEP_0178930094 /NCGR_PEP_ID=MMETSP0786-20121207/21022_1 /TAXON_ID=186022 /ORGANISM="Thalassionema frauenfeldii, Strain CCMP 1798" /LENGTH=311 /DNA_ID=CAMNT_0020606539 /DNA_START=207 /DNA_END=1142 /DNA_ORIENTATION=-